jgi:hypothetical protein
MSGSKGNEENYASRCLIRMGLNQSDVCLARDLIEKQDMITIFLFCILRGIKVPALFIYLFINLFT